MFNVGHPPRSERKALQTCATAIFWGGLRSTTINWLAYFQSGKSNSNGAFGRRYISPINEKANPAGRAEVLLVAYPIEKKKKVQKQPFIFLWPKCLGVLLDTKENFADIEKEPHRSVKICAR